MARFSPKNLRLRVWLVALMLALVAFGLIVSGFGVTVIRRHILVEALDQQLVDAASGWALESRPDFPPDMAAEKGRPPSRFHVQGVDARGVEWIVDNDVAGRPALPASNDVGPAPVTLGSVDGSPLKWRALTVRSRSGELITVALDLSDVDSRVRSLVVLQVGIGTVVLVMLGIAGRWIVQRSLEPLVEIERTAAAIAAGHLESRVPQGNSNTEVGQLSLALNGMLAQIQRAIASSEASADTARLSEDRMRQFITDASHELRTPLTTIRGFAELYRQGGGDVEMAMSRIEGESKRMAGLVEDLLLLAQLDARRPLERRRVDLLALASDAVHDAKSIAPARPIAIEFLPGPGTPEVIGDEARLRQVIGNLVANALQHTPPNARITLRVGTSGNHTVLEVVDRGPGMRKQDADRVFERFYRADSSRTRASGGTGLGLSIVDSLVRAHGGRVSVTTAPGDGCCFSVILPRVLDDDLADHLAEDARSAQPAVR